MTCVRCAEIRAAPALDLVLFWAPDRTPTARDGEIIRTMALVEHAKAGHPTELDYR